MKKPTLFLLLGSIIAVAYFAWSPSTPIDPAVDLLPGDGWHGRDDPGQLRSGAGNPRRRRADDTPAVPRRRANLLTLTVRGRCLAAATGAPIAGCEVRISAYRSKPRRGKPADATEHADGHTGADGRFAIGIRTESSSHLECHVRAHGYGDMTGPVGGRGIERALLDIKLPAGALLIGRVENENGVAQPAIKLRLFRRTAGQQPAIHALNWLLLSSDAGGVLQSGARLACQTWSLSAADEGVRVVQPAANFEITGGQTSQHLTVVVKLPDPRTTIRGVLVDTEDQPVARAVINAKDGGKWPVGFGYSKADGSFTVRCRREPGAPVRLEVPQAIGYETLLTAVSHAWGTEGLRLVLERAGDVRVVVTEQGSGTAVEDFQAVWYQTPQSGQRITQKGRLQPGHYQDGEAVIEAVPRGPTHLVVIPSDRRLAANEPLAFTRADGQTTLQVRLPARARLEVLVTDANNHPIPRTAVELLRSGGEAPIRVTTRAHRPEQYAQFAARPSHQVLLLDQAKTGDDGRAVLGWPTSADSLTVRVRGPRHVPMVQGGIVLNQDPTRLQIRVQMGGRLHGLVGPLEVLRLLGGERQSRWRNMGPRLVLKRLNSDSHQQQQVTLGDDGSFAVLGLAPGTWEVRFTSTLFSGGRSVRSGEHLLGQVDLSEGGSQQRHYDISELRPASLRGRVHLNGALAIQTNIQLIRREPSAGRRAGNSMMLFTDDNGSFHAEQITPGRYTVSVQVRGSSRRRPWLSSSTTIEVPPGGTVSQDFYAQAGSLRLRIVNPDGSAAANRYFQVRNKTSRDTATGQSDANGVFTIEALSVGDYLISTLTKNPTTRTGPARKLGAAQRGQLTVVGEAKVVSGGSPTTIQLTLPPK